MLSCSVVHQLKSQGFAHKIIFDKNIKRFKNACGPCNLTTGQRIIGQWFN